jgi:sulfopyruvate decarboxylase TPP-binding subunit
MLDGPSVAKALADSGVTHVVWLPDSELGTWEAGLLAEPRLRLVRVCREGEAFAVAAGLLLGGARPVVLVQCTGLFEAGDSLRNAVHDLALPLFAVVGARSWKAHRSGGTPDTCPRFVEPIVAAWGLPVTWLDDGSTADDLARAYVKARDEGRSHVALLAE